MKLTYKEWIKEIAEEIINDTLWKMTVYRYALFLSDAAWKDVNTLSKNKLLISSCDQLFRSAGSVSANISEGYSKRSKLDQARYYDYALASARECRRWYFKIRHSLDAKNFDSRIKLLTEIIKMLLYVVPKTRGKKIKEPQVKYSANGTPQNKIIENMTIHFPD